MYFVPQSRAIPVFGKAAAKDYLWTLNISPGFFGQGIITGPIIPLHMLVGAIIGWGVLGPLARQRGWAPGDVGDWETGPRGWFIWVSVTGLMADASVKLAWFILGPIWRKVTIGLLGKGWGANDGSAHLHLEPLLSHTEAMDEIASSRARKTTEAAGIASRPPMKPRSLQLGFVLATLICVVTAQVSFSGIIPWYHVFLGVLLALPMAIVGIRSLAEADYNPESALCE